MKPLRLASVLACVAGAIAIPATASASVQVGSSGWQWGNPLPQGNTLRAMSFAGNDGYAAGDFGTLLRTSDGGTSWSGLLSGTYTDLTIVQAIDADAVFAGGGCVGRRSDDGGATFRRVAFTPVESSCAEQLAAGWFVDRLTGFLVLTDGTVLRTDNNGDTFAQKNPLPGTRAQGGGAKPTQLVFTDATTGVGTTDNGKIYRTTDGANSWTLVADNDRAVRSVLFFGAKDGVAVGDGSLFLSTADGGASWSSHSLGVPSTQLTSARCATTKLCVMTTQSGTSLVRTDDGGDSATLVTASPDPIFAAAFASPTRIAATGATGTTAVSDDAGRTFSPIGGRLTGTYSSIRAGGQPGTAFAPGDNGSLAKTTDGGHTWTRGNVSTPADVLDVAFPTAQIGFALDVAGGLFRTNDATASWKGLDTGTTARPRALAAPTTSTVILVGPTGLRRSTDGGDTFDTVTDRDVVKAKLDAIDRAGSALVASGPRDLLRSTDAGKSWTPIHKPGRVRAADFVSASRGFLLTDKGALFGTSNAGRRWTPLNGIGTDNAYGIAFSSASRGYLVINRFGDVTRPSGFLMTTSDGGRTWHPQFVVATPIAQMGIASASNGTDYLLGGTSSLLFTTTRGAAGKASTLTVRTAHTKLRRAASITVVGRLSPASGGERVTVSSRAPGRTTWRHQTVKVAANGSYTTSWRVTRGTNTFVAQWAGDFRSQGDGSDVLSVRVAR